MFHNSKIAELNATADALEKSAKAIRKEAIELASRGLGRTTTQALKILSAAYDHPGKVIGVYDHHGTDQAHYALRRKVLDMAAALGLQGFVACGMNSHHTADGHAFGVKYVKPTL